MVVQVLDDYYLTITLLVTVGYQLTGFAIAWTLQFDKITDFTGGSNFFILALLTLLLNGTHNARNIIASVLCMVWAVRLAGFLLYRVLKTGSDTRFDDIRSGFFSFLGFWVGQIVWVWTVMLPVTILNSPAITEPFPNPAFGTSRDIAGIVLWGVGWLIETIADADKFRWKSSKPSKAEFMNRGLWGWSRHPPYFGEMMCWWGIWILSISPSTDGEVTFQAKQAQYAALASPIFTVILLMFASGVPTAEKPMAKRMYLVSYGATARTDHAGAWQAYREYLNQTSILIPLPPILYRPLPQVVKRYLLFDFPMFQFDEDKDGKQALEEQ